MSVLGSLMLDKDAIFHVLDILTPRDFYKPIHQTIYEVMLELSDRHEPVDIVSVTTRLKEKGALDEVGGSAYLATLVNTVPTASHIMHYATIVRRKRMLRDLISASEEISRLGYQEADEVDKVIDEAEQKIFGVAKETIRQHFMPISIFMESAWDRIEKLHSESGKGALRGITTGFSDIDNYLGGLQRSDLIVLAARPSLGKTSLALNIARNAALAGTCAVGVFSLEMSREQLIDRLIASEAGVDLWQLRTGNLAEEDFVRIRDAMETLSKAQFFIDDTPSPSIMEIRAKARRLRAEHNLGLLVVDYLQLIKGPDAESRVQEVSAISRSLKALAKELDIPVLAVSQLSRGVEMRHPAIPKLSDLRESGSIEQDADVVMFIYRPDRDNKNAERTNIAEILIEKHRNGPTGKVELYFHDATSSFRPLAKHYEEPL